MVDNTGYPVSDRFDWTDAVRETSLAQKVALATIGVMTEPPDAIRDDIRLRVNAEYGNCIAMLARLNNVREAVSKRKHELRDWMDAADERNGGTPNPGFIPRVEGDE